MSASILIQLLTMVPQLVKAVQQIMASDAAHTIESAVNELLNHNTAGKPNSAVLSPQAIDFQAPKS